MKKQFIPIIDMREYVNDVASKKIILTTNTFIQGKIAEGIANDYGKDGRELFITLFSHLEGADVDELNKMYNDALKKKDNRLHIDIVLCHAERAGYGSGKYYYQDVLAAIKKASRESYAEDAEEENTKAITKPRKATFDDMLNFLETYFVIVYNVVKDITLFRTIEEKTYKVLDDRAFKKMISQFRSLGFIVKLEEFSSLVFSDMMKSINPIKEYFNSLPAWHPGMTDYVRELADMVTLVDNSPSERESFYYFLKKYLVGMVRMWLDIRGTINQLILCFIGDQGIGKTWFMMHLLPPELRDYFLSKTFTGNINRDDKIAISDFALINLDELDNMKQKDINALKSLTSDDSSNERPIYGINRKKRHRIASFCATGNNPHILNDPTGTRRWVMCWVKLVNMTRKINYEGLYSQLYALALDEDFCCWLSKEDNAKIDERNTKFNEPIPELELILKHYCKPIGNMTVNLVSTSDILLKINNGIRNQLSTSKIGLLMGKLGFDKTRTNKCVKYIVHEYTPAEIADNEAAEIAIAKQEGRIQQDNSENQQSAASQTEIADDMPF